LNLKAKLENSPSYLSYQSIDTIAFNTVSSVQPAPPYLGEVRGATGIHVSEVHHERRRAALAPLLVVAAEVEIKSQVLKHFLKL
jgi:hypothetical protein